MLRSRECCTFFFSRLCCLSWLHNLFYLKLCQSSDYLWYIYIFFLLNLDLSRFHMCRSRLVFVEKSVISVMSSVIFNCSPGSERITLRSASDSGSGGRIHRWKVLKLFTSSAQSLPTLHNSAKQSSNCAASVLSCVFFSFFYLREGEAGHVQASAVWERFNSSFASVMWVFVKGTLPSALLWWW